MNEPVDLNGHLKKNKCLFLKGDEGKGENTND